MSVLHKVYIIGFMGSGKSTTGKKLASAIGWSFIDLDRKIEEESGKSIPELFSQYGEEHFRKVEAEVLKSLKSTDDVVISTGGGTPCYEDNMDYMVETGLTLYLKLTPGQLRSRLYESSTERPLLKDLDYDGLLEFITGKLALREKWYNLSEITVEGMDLDISLLASLVESGLKI
jgi:shikimate kinase